MISQIRCKKRSCRNDNGMPSDFFGSSDMRPPSECVGVCNVPRFNFNMVASEMQKQNNKKKMIVDSNQKANNRR